MVSLSSEFRGRIAGWRFQTLDEKFRRRKSHSSVAAVAAAMMDVGRDPGP